MAVACGVSLRRVILPVIKECTWDYREKVVYVGPCVEEVEVEEKWREDNDAFRVLDQETQSSKSRLLWPLCLLWVLPG